MRGREVEHRTGVASSLDRNGTTAPTRSGPLSRKRPSAAQRKIVPTGELKMEAFLRGRRKGPKRCHENGQEKNCIFSANIQFSDLPLDVLGMILSKLPPKETVRTSVLSKKWKHIWTVCPKLRFDGATMCGDDVAGTQHYTQKFVGNVNGVLKQYHGKVVEELEVKFEFDATLAEHLDDWVSFALSAQATNLALDLVPGQHWLPRDRYRFPMELFDGESISHLQHLQLSFVSFESPSWFNGFPNLKKLDLHALFATRKDLEDMLSNCFNLEWLSIVRCHLDDEQLTVLRPLPRLLYLHVADCDISRVEFRATNVSTFVYRGGPIPFCLGPALALKDARLYFIGKITLEFALTVLPNLLPSAQNLVLHSSWTLEKLWLQGNSSNFSQLKNLELKFFLWPEYIIDILSLASLLSAAPFLEKLVIHFVACNLPHGSELIRRLPGTTLNYLKDLCITGFAGCMGQVELLAHIVENAPNLEALTIDRVNSFGYNNEYERQLRSKALDIARKHLYGRTSQNTKVSML